MDLKAEPSVISHGENSTELKIAIWKEDLLWFKSAKFLASILGLKAKLVLYIHQQGQLIRNFDKPVHAFGIYHFTPSNEYMVVNVVHVSVLRKRPDGIIPCNPDLQDDDEKFLKQSKN